MVFITRLLAVCLYIYSFGYSVISAIAPVNIN